MVNPSPLRYPGGKAKLEPFIRYLITNKFNNKINTYIEPFAGGAGVALALLFNGTVENIIINDYDKAIYSFWRAVTTENKRFINTLIEIDISVDEWKKQREIYNNCIKSKCNRKHYSFELGFSTFYLNRTNHSGIITAGPIGGFNQNGNYLIDARFNKSALIQKIKKIGEFKKNIRVYNKDIRNFISQVAIKHQDNSFIYFDPPYFIKGKELYTNYFKFNDHSEIFSYIDNRINCPWIITYDVIEEIKKLYISYKTVEYDLVYSLANKGHASEIMIFSDEYLCPTKEELTKNNIKIKIH